VVFEENFDGKKLEIKESKKLYRDISQNHRSKEYRGPLILITIVDWFDDHLFYSFYQ
jgi:hypothetical protein